MRTENEEYAYFLGHAHVAETALQPKLYKPALTVSAVHRESLSNRMSPPWQP